MRSGWIQLALAILFSAPVSGATTAGDGAGSDAAGTRPAALREASTIRWRSGEVALPAQDPADVEWSLLERGTGGTPAHFVVRFSAPLTAAQRQRVAGSGLRLLSPLGGGSYFASVDPGLAEGLAPAAEVLDLVAAVGEVSPLWKLHPHFLEEGIPTWAVVEERAEAPENPVVAVYALFHEDVALWPEGWALAALHGARVRSELRTVNALVLEIPYRMIEPLAASDRVQFVEPALPPLRGVADGVRAQAQVNVAQAAPYGLDGDGVRVMVYDSGGPFSGHADFGGRVTARDDIPAVAHTTAVCGVLAGDGAASAGLYRGVAPAALLDVWTYEQAGGLTPGFLYTDPGDLEADYLQAFGVLGADLANNSIGTNAAPNGFPCAWEGDYGVTSAVIDAVVRGELTGAPLRVVWAAGNERQGLGNCGNAYHTTAPPSGAKNHVTVGAINSDDASMTGFSSWGPTDDGRLKPDLCAPGCQLSGDEGVTTTAVQGGYLTACGTSFAAPVVSGVAALLLQDYRARFPGREDFDNAMLKAWLVQSAADLGPPGPDYRFGYGAVRAADAIELMRSGRWTSGAVSTGDAHPVILVVEPGAGPLAITLAWSDAPGTPNVLPNLVNDLDLRVIGPGGTLHRPWTLDPAAPDQPAVRTREDHVNNLEQVVIDAPRPGVYRVDVHGFDVPAGPQPFALCAGAAIVDCSSTATITLDRTRYGCAADATVRLVDCDLDADGSVAETVEVTVISTSEPAGETVALHETGPATAVFEGSVPLSASDGPGVLLVADGDAIEAASPDGDGDAGPAIAAAVVDCGAPSVLAVETVTLEPLDATVRVVLDEPARAILRYGPACGIATATIESPMFLTEHVLDLAGLEQETTYYLSIELEDEAGNAATADAGGACYAVTTPAAPAAFYQAFLGPINDLDDRLITFAPVPGVDGYEVCTLPIDGLPVDPAAGTLLALGDDDAAMVELPNGATVSLYGVAYDTLFVGSNGYVTFGAPDTDYTESPGDHFDLPRVSALFDDLNPLAGGAVSRLLLEDRLVITWLAVPEFSADPSPFKPPKPDFTEGGAAAAALAPAGNTFQIQLFFDGTIELAFRAVSTEDGLVGISDGSGIPVAAQSTDFSAAAACGPRPPIASDQTLQTPVNTERVVPLRASDDGIPEPLTYVVTSLPLYPLIDAGLDRVIEPADLPYALPDGGALLRYRPTGLFNGFDSFTFRADDGGTPPEGGASPEATMTVLVGGLQLVHDVPLDADPGWSTEGGWAYGAPTGGGSGAGDPTAGHTGPNCYGYRLDGDYENNLFAPQYLTTAPFDCTDVTGTRVRFRQWLGIESATFDRATVEVSVDGMTWVTVWQHTGDTLDQAGWIPRSYDVSPWADGEPAVQVRWGMGPTDGSVHYPGWNVDDVQIWGIRPFVPPGDVNGDGLADALDVADVLLAFGACSGDACVADVNGDGVVNIDDLVIVILSWTGSGTAPAGGAGAPAARGGGGAATDDAGRDGEDGAAFVASPAHLAPAARGGVIAIEGDLDLDDATVVAMEIAGSRPVDEHDLIVVEGTARLAGEWRVALVEGVAPPTGAPLVLLVADRIEGGFSRTILDDDLSAGGASLVIDRERGVIALRADGAAPAPSPAGSAPSVRAVLELLEAWGPAPGDPGDLDGDGLVDADDLRIMLEAIATAGGG